MQRRGLTILPQPSDTSCGPTCLHAVYRYYGESLALEEIMEDVHQLETGGTLAVHLAVHALRRGYRARIYTYNLQLFDPTWFVDEDTSLSERMQAQLRRKRNRPRLRSATEAYLEYLHLGGEVRYEDLSLALLRRYLEERRPILTGLSSTYLYRSAREVGHDGEYDSIGGEPGGHFVVLHGLREEEGKPSQVRVSDPYQANPLSDDLHYAVDVERLIGAILLGIVTYDANLLVIEPG